MESSNDHYRGPRCGDQYIDPTQNSSKSHLRRNNCTTCIVNNPTHVRELALTGASAKKYDEGRRGVGVSIDDVCLLTPRAHMRNKTLVIDTVQTWILYTTASYTILLLTINNTVLYHMGYGIVESIELTFNIVLYVPLYS